MHWGSFPMVPFAGRVRHGRFTFDGRVHELPIDMPPHAIHGTGYIQPWHVDAVGDSEMSMSCDLAWELGGRAWQRVEVVDTFVRCVLGVVAGGLLIGQTLALTGMLYDVLADVVIYLAMALVLLVRPRGLFGQEGMSEE